MKKILLFTVLLFCFTCNMAFADRETATITNYKTSQLIKRGEGRIYAVSFVATANGGNFILYDATSATQGFDDIFAEGSEATSANSQFQDYTKKPLEFSTGLYIAITNGYAIVEYE